MSGEQQVGPNTLFTILPSNILNLYRFLGVVDKVVCLYTYKPYTFY